MIRFHPNRLDIIGNLSVFMAVTTLGQMRQMPHTEIDEFFYLKNIKYKSLFR